MSIWQKAVTERLILIERLKFLRVSITTELLGCTRLDKMDTSLQLNTKCNTISPTLSWTTKGMSSLTLSLAWVLWEKKQENSSSTSLSIHCNISTINLLLTETSSLTIFSSMTSLTLRFLTSD